MNEAINRMIQKRNPENSEDYENALKEIIQEIALLGLSRSDFFAHAAFYGGTALRIFCGLPRYSEDLDFSLDSPDASFDLEKYLKYIEQELSAYHLEMTVRKKVKTKESAVQSAFIKGNTVTSIMEISDNPSSVSGIHTDALIRIKVEIDTDPPAGAGYQILYGLNPAPYSARLYDEPSLFAGKIHAVLCRDYKNRVKGRDFFDYVWYLQRGSKVNLLHLQNRMVQSGKWNPEEILTLDALKRLLAERFAEVDYESAKEDVSRFLRPEDRQSLSLWNSQFFDDLTERYLFSSESDH